MMTLTITDRLHLPHIDYTEAQCPLLEAIATPLVGHRMCSHAPLTRRGTDCNYNKMLSYAAPTSRLRMLMETAPAHPRQ